MKTTAVRMYGKKDLRLETFELPEIQDDEILFKVVSDTICMSTYKASLLGEEHQRINNDISEHPIIIGHEFAGIITKVGAHWKNKYQVGESYTIQPALNIEGSMKSVGYSFHYCGGDATYTILDPIVMEKNCLLPFDKSVGFYNASLAEPMSCIIGAFHSMYHSKRGVYKHNMGIIEGGKSALMACCGPMGLGAISYMLTCDRKPSLLVVTDINDQKLARAEKLFPVQYAKQQGVTLYYVNTKDIDNPTEYLKELTDGTGFDDISVYAPVKQVIEMADNLLSFDGCLNFFAGPVDKNLKAELNFYDVHYDLTHIVGSSGGTTKDMEECLGLLKEGLNPSTMITHIGGLEAVIHTTLNLPQLGGGKKLIYPWIHMPLIALSDLRAKSQDNPLFAELADIVEKNNGLWSAEAENYLLKTFNAN